MVIACFMLHVATFLVNNVFTSWTLVHHGLLQPFTEFNRKCFQLLPCVFDHGLHERHWGDVRPGDVKPFGVWHSEPAWSWRGRWQWRGKGPVCLGVLLFQWGFDWQAQLHGQRASKYVLPSCPCAKLAEAGAEAEPMVQRSWYRQFIVPVQVQEFSLHLEPRNVLWVRVPLVREYLRQGDRLAFQKDSRAHPCDVELHQLWGKEKDSHWVLLCDERQQDHMPCEEDGDQDDHQKIYGGVDHPHDVFEPGKPLPGLQAMGSSEVQAQQLDHHQVRGNLHVGVVKLKPSDMLPSSVGGLFLKIRRIEEEGSLSIQSHHRHAWKKSLVHAKECGSSKLHLHICMGFGAACCVFFPDHKSTARVYVGLIDALHVVFSCWLVIL